MWIDSWGPTVGWVIRIGCVVLGAVLLVVGMKGKSAEQESEQGG